MKKGNFFFLLLFIILKDLFLLFKNNNKKKTVGIFLFDRRMTHSAVDKEEETLHARTHTHTHLWHHPAAAVQFFIFCISLLNK